MDKVSAFQPDIWVLQSHASGDNEQCLALAETLGRPALVKQLDWKVADAAEDRATIRRFLADTEEGWRWRRHVGLREPWPSVVICCGRRSSRAAFWIKHQSGGRTKVVSIGRAHRAIDSYDLLVATPQFLLPNRPNVVSVRLPLVRQRYIRKEAAAPRSHIVSAPKPWFTILLGGEVKQFDAAESTLMEAALRAQMAADFHGGSVLISTSRRTPDSLLAAVEGVLYRPRVYRWSAAAADDNPYETLLHDSACLFVTADSASMILDGCAAGTPTYIIEYPERMDLRRRWRRALFGCIRRLSEGLRNRGLPRVAARLDEAQDWLHARGILRYPRDLRRVHASVYGMGLAHPAAAFDPAILPARKTANDLTEISGIREVVARCQALHGWAARRAAE